MVAESVDEEEFCRLEIGCPILVTERLVMRPPHEEDVPELAELAANRRVAEMLARMPHPYGEREARAFVERSRTGGAGCTYALTLAETGAFIGCAGLDARNGALELGYWVGEPFWGNGYATEAAHALVDLAFRVTDIDRLAVACRVTNAGSRRVIHKCGFQFAGQGMMDSIVAGRVPVERYTLDRRTWVSLRSWARS